MLAGSGMDTKAWTCFRMAEVQSGVMFATLSVESGIKYPYHHGRLGLDNSLFGGTWCLEL